MSVAAELRELDADDERRSSPFDVLLQLTLPIVLILALVVVTEVTTLQDALRQVEIAEEDSVLDRTRRKTQTMILEIQRQLLVKAVDETRDQIRVEVGLDAYGREAPSVAEIMAGTLPEAFAETSRGLAARMNGNGRILFTSAFESRVLVRFEELVNETIARGGIEEERTSLLKLSPVNRAATVENIAGVIAEMEAEAADVQVAVLIDWIESNEANAMLKSRTVSIWRRLLGGDDEEFEEFVNVKARGFFERMQDLDIVALDAARAMSL